MKHSLMSLPYDQSALEPYISAETLSYHYGKHHAAYVNKLNALIEGTVYDDMTLEQIVKSGKDAVFNNAAQVYNHDFYWNGLSANVTLPSAELTDLIERDFGSIEIFKEKFLTTAAGVFGSGWVWLVATQEGGLRIETTSNADTPIRYGYTPLLACDVWEHAYYIDYRNVRPDYLASWWKVINWNFVSGNLANFENSRYDEPCNQPGTVCEYVDIMQANEHTPS